MARTDIHRPSAIDPSAYQFVAFNYLKVEDIGAAMFLAAERERLQAHMARTGGHYSGHEHGGNCHICGSVNAIYTAVFYHEGTNSYVKTGLDCATKLECGDIDDFRRKVQSALEAQKGRRKAKALLDASDLSLAWTVYSSDRKADEPRQEEIIRDLIDKLIRYGSFSDAQWAFLRRLVGQVENRPAIEAERAAEHAAASPVPVTDDRIVIRGKVVMVRKADGFRVFYDQMMIQHDTGWKVMGGLPSALANVAPGAIVEFSATVKASDRDPKFGFFKRPTKVRQIDLTPTR